MIIVKQAFTLFILIAIILCQIASAQDTASNRESLHEIFQSIEHQTDFKFLYRDAIIAGKQIDFVIDSYWQSSLRHKLNSIGLEASVDEERKRVVVYQLSESAVDVQDLSGYVIDGESGERLPFATVSLSSGVQSIKSTQTNLNGFFKFPQSASNETITIRVSYVGYRSEHLEFSADLVPENGSINIRLTPSRIEISDITVSGSTSQKPADSVYRGILDMGTFSPFGESNSVRMLQMLPSVSHGTSLSEGAFIRGSNSDALQVTLDGSVIYNHSHLFGLIDSFNPDVIRTGSFYYDAAPARYHAPPGGVLNLVTQTGSLYDFGGSFGLSNSVIKAGIDGPIKKGKSSFLIAGRHSILNSINLFNTSEMVSWGLDIDRETSLPDGSMDLNDRIVTPGDYSVDFYDLHTKLFFEQSAISSWTISGYLGGDNTSQTSERIFRLASNSSRRFDRSDFKTENTWGNRSANVSYYRTLNSDRLLHIQGGFSYLYTSYLKEDFVYQRPGSDPDRPPLFLSDFENESELNHGYVSGELQTDHLTVGGSLNIYDSAYRELSLNRSEFFQRTRPVMPEVYAEYHAGDATTSHTVNAGIRFQYFSDGSYTNLSPRIKTTLFQNSPVSFGVSVGRNYQYLYRLSINNQTTSDIWMMALEDQSPAYSNHLSGNISFSPWQDAFFQIEGYVKQQKNLRFHEITFQNIESTFGGSPLFNDNDGFSRGVELMFRQAFGKADIVQTYTYGITELKNNRFRDGEWFFAEWDRRHRFNTFASYDIYPGLNASINWIYSTGRPDQIRLARDTQARLGSYSRLDLSLGYSTNIQGGSFSVQAGIYNLTNRQNPWYRDWVQTIDSSGFRPQLSPELVDVYDLGIQPSVSMGVYF